MPVSALFVVGLTQFVFFCVSVCFILDVSLSHSSSVSLLLSL